MVRHIGKVAALSILITFGIVSSASSASNIASAHFVKNDFQAIRIANGDQTGLNLQPGFTIESWVNVASQPDESWQYTILSKYGFGDIGRSYYLSYTTLGGAQFLHFVSTAAETPTQNTDQFLPIHFPENEWHHVAVTYDTEGTVQFYIDGDLAGTFTGAPTTLVTSTSDFRIGSIGFDGPGREDQNDYFDGSIDEVRIWDHVRTKNEIKTNRRKVLNIADKKNRGLLGYWRMENNFTDETTNGNDMVPNLASPTFTSDSAPVH